MDTDETPKKKYFFIIIIPHKDVQRQLEEYRHRLFSIGFQGAHSFPICAPLAVVSRPFSREELKELAQRIREQNIVNDGKITGKESTCISCAGFSFYGPDLSININEIKIPAKNKLLFTLSKVLLCAALLDGNTEHSAEELPGLSFRAASVANLSISPLDKTGFSYYWETGPQIWLPAYKK